MENRQTSISGAYVFVALLAGAIGLAWLFPEPGAKGGWLHTGVTTRVAVVMVFIMQGLALPTREVVKGLFQYPLHVAIQVFGFVLIPVMAYAALLFCGGLFPPDLHLGFLFVATVPTTISTSIVYTTASGGAGAVALFNASLSNILGVFVVPLWMSLQVSQKTPIPPAGAIILEIALMILLPFAMGQVARVWLGRWGDAYKGTMSRVSMGLILFIIYAAFCNSVKSRMWQTLNSSEILLAFAATLCLILLVMLAGRIWWKAAGYDRASGIAFFFCATQKAISTGVPMAYSIFGATQVSVALVILPLLFYHPLQLLLGSFIVARFRRIDGSPGIPS